MQISSRGILGKGSGRGTRGRAECSRPSRGTREACRERRARQAPQRCGRRVVRGDICGMEGAGPGWCNRGGFSPYRLAFWATRAQLSTVPPSKTWNVSWMFYPWHRACASCRKRCWNEPRDQPSGKILPTTRLLSSRPSAPHSILHPALRTLAQVAQASVDSAQAPVMGGHPLHRCVRPSPPWSQVSNLLEQRTRRSQPFWPEVGSRNYTIRVELENHSCMSLYFPACWP